MGYRVITVSSEFESRGPEIAQAVAKELKIVYVDKFLIEESARQSGIRLDSVTASDEMLASAFEYSQARAAHYYADAESPLPTSAQVAQIQFQLIAELAEKEPCIIVGRCGNHVLRERDDVLSVFIHAGRDSRVQRTMESLKLSEKEAVRVLRRTDKARKAYIKNYTGAVWNDPNQFDLILNSDRMTPELCVDLICRAYGSGLHGKKE